MKDSPDERLKKMMERATEATENGEMDYAIQKSQEFFESLTWEGLKGRELSPETELKCAIVLSEVGDQLEEKLGISPENFGKMLVIAGATILAARKDCKDHETRRWN